MYPRDYNILIDKLNDFTRRYYRNQIERGILLFFTIGLFFAISIITLEYFGHFNSSIRMVFFYAIFIVYSIILCRFVLWPLLFLFNVRKGLNHFQAARIIQEHFPDIQDKFINTLELAAIINQRPYSLPLILASIEQKAQTIHPLPFKKAIDIKVNYRLLKYLAAVVALTLFIYLYKPDIIKEGSTRIFYYNKEFIKPAPFSFNLLNDTLVAEQGSDFELNLKVQGSVVPQNVYLVVGSSQLLMKPINKYTFTYTFKGVNRDIRFYFTADGFNSSTYDLKIFYPPRILELKAEIIPPAYTGLQNQFVENTGDITIPQGSHVRWSIKAMNADSLSFFVDSIQYNANKERDIFTFSHRFLNSCEYKIIPTKNGQIPKQNSSYKILTIPDRYPVIAADFITDSTHWGTYYFKGTLSDDYGFKNLNFVVRFENDSVKTIAIPIQKNILNQEFYFAYDFSTLNNYKGSLEFYFEVWDNDAINGSKSTRTPPMKFKIPDKEELKKYEAETSKNIYEQMNRSEKITDNLIKEIKQLQKNIANSNNVSWEHTQKLQQLLEKQMQLEKQIRQISEMNKQKNAYINTFNPQDQQILEKQQQIQELLDKLLDDELKKMIEELQKLIQNIDKEKLKEITEEFKIRNEEIQQELDRTLELLKKLDVEQKMNNLINDLNDLANKQENLSEQTRDKKVPLDSLKKIQNQYQQEFQKFTEEYKELMKENNQLAEPFSLPSFEEQQNEISKELQQTNEQLQQENRRNASKSQQNAAKKMKELSQQMQQTMQQNLQEANAEDEQSLKMTLENVKNLSFAQEELLKQTKETKVIDPRFNQIIEKQTFIKGNINVIEDSLKALGKRNPMINAPIKQHLRNLKNYNREALLALDQKNAQKAAVQQQLVMTEANELALLLGDIIKQLQNANQQMCNGGQCKKPGKGKPIPSYQQMKDMQNQIKQQLQSILDQMKKGQNKEGQKMSEQLGKMISTQDKLNQMLNEMMQQPGISPESMKKLQEIKNLMNEVQKDIANKNITPQTIQRQEQILTRLLEAEKSDNERDTENKRESETGKNDKISNPKEIFQYKSIKSNYDQILEKMNLPINKFYEELYRRYIINLNRQVYERHN